MDELFFAASLSNAFYATLLKEEEEDEEEKMKVRRTMSKMDPNGFTERDA